MDNDKILSIDSLNEVLSKLRNGIIPSFLGQFSSVDIIFIAGLMLEYEKKRDERWIKFGIKYSLNNNTEGFEIRQYFQQYKELYGVDWKDVFTEFSYASQDESKQNPNMFSKFSAPILYVNKDTILYFFAQKKNERVEKIKNIYAGNFTISDFIDKRSKNYMDKENSFIDYENNIKQRLENSAPIFTFIFIIASKNLAEKKNQSFDKRKEYIEKLWLFALNYERGLYELAKNIVEHSGSGEQKGEGMMTIRAYHKDKTDLSRTLETHVFDYGEKGIVPTLIQYTREKALGNNIKNQKIKQCYISDDIFFKENNRYELKSYISGDKILEQQRFRHTSHYGINRLHKLIQSPLNGQMFVASQGKENRDYYGENSKNLTIKSGTHYYFRIPFISNNFSNIIAKPFLKENQTAILGDTASLEFLSSLRHIKINLSQYAQISQENPENSLIDITVDYEKITKENIDNIYSLLHTSMLLNSNNRIAINLEDKICDVSVLLRFLSYLTFEYSQPFIIYNIKYQIYNELLSDNRDFQESRPSEAYWHNERAILLFIKTDNNFYFSDILFGQNRKEFLYVNNIISKTFPNTITLLQEIDDKQKNHVTDHLTKINSSQNLQQFFYPESNTLLPFDTLLKHKEDKPLFVSNLTTILQNSLFGRKSTYNNLTEYIENFDGFHIVNTHFKIGTKIHSEDFYYAKRLFQNSFYTARLAMNIAFKIRDKINIIEQKITLVGYEMYSELLLGLVEKFLTDFGANKEYTNHFITQSENENSDNNFKFLPKETFDHYLKNYKNNCTIIIVPIAATGNTARKIENDIREQIYKYEKGKISKQYARRLSDEYEFFEPRYNILLAQPEKGFTEIKQSNTNQETIISLPAKWHNIKDCPLCYGTDENKNDVTTKTLFETDKSSLTPAFIFENPKGKSKSIKGKEFDSEVPFDDINFTNSLKYKRVFRNNNYRIYYIESDKYIDENIPNIKKWLSDVVKEQLKLNPTDKVIIVSPCHESNSRFLNLINKIVFASSATIIHYQSNVDFAENFILLNKSSFSKETKLFYVDDSLITGKHFFEIFNITKSIAPFHAAIFLNDKSEPSTHNEVVEISKRFFSFANFNQPPVLNLLEQRPLEHERQRYESLAKVSLHDITIKTFQDKANSLNPLKINEIKDTKTATEKKIRRLKCFEATHKIYAFFAERKIDTPNYEIDKIVKFKDYISTIDLELFPEYTTEVNKKKKQEQKDNLKVLLKVLSQYPFNLYKPLKEKTFDWLKKWLNELESPNQECFTQADYDNFQTTKFLLRRATLLGNYQVLEKSFLQKLLCWFIKIDKYYAAKEKPLLAENTDKNKERNKNLLDFPIYALRNYIEMIHKNGWVAYHIQNNIDNEMQMRFMNSKQGAQFLSMLQIGFALTIEDFYEMIVKEQRIAWRDMFRYADGEEQKPENQRRFNMNLITRTDRIVDFFNNIPQLIETTKFQIVKEMFLKDSDCLKTVDSPFIIFLWIKQLLFADCIAKDSHFPKDIGYQTKINSIIRKMKTFFPKAENMSAFFIVTDGKQNPHILSQDNYLLNGFNEEFNADRKINNLSKEIKQLEEHADILTDEDKKELKKKKAEKARIETEKKRYKTQLLIDFLYGIECSTCITTETTAEFYRERSSAEIQNELINNSQEQNIFADNWDLFSNTSLYNNATQWINAYKKETVNLSFMPDDSKWLYLIRISKRNERTDKFDASGLLGFYSTENLYSTNESLLPKQLLMLLRRDMGKFIEKHHKNEEFAELIQQKEKSDYQFMLRHGINDYRIPIQNYFNKIYDLIPHKNDESEKLRKYYRFALEHLTNKIDLMQKFNKFDPDNPNNFETFSLHEIIETFYSDYEIILKYERRGLYYLDEQNNINDFIQIIDNTSKRDELLNMEIDFPLTVLEEMIFELVYNIRKHVLNLYSAYIKKDKLKILLDFTIENNILYFKISNNYCDQREDFFNCIYNNNKLDGLNLINCILKKANIGIVKVTKTGDETYLKDQIVNIYIPLKQMI